MKIINHLLQESFILVKKIIKYIPGFRTGEKANMIIASVYYLCCILFMIIGLQFVEDVNDTMDCISVAGGMILLPILLFSFANMLNNK